MISPSSHSKGVRLGLFLTLFFVLWSPDFAYSWCDYPPNISIYDITLDCHFDDGNGGPDPIYSGFPKTSASCAYCDPCPPTYTDKVVSSGNGTCPYPKVIKRTWTTSACGKSASVCQTITLVDNTGPVFKCEVTKFYVDCGKDYSPATLGYPDVYDSCNKDVDLTYVDYELPGVCPIIKVIKRVWTATDPCGNKSYFIQWIYIKNSNGPTWSYLPPNCTRDCSETCTETDCGTPRATCSCSEAIVKRVSDKELDDKSSCGGKTILRLWEAKDVCDNKIYFKQYIFFTDNTPPYWVTFPDNVTLGCKDSTSPSYTGAPTAYDKCSRVCDIRYKDYTQTGKCPYQRTIKRVWKACDKCGNCISRAQYIYIQDNEPPTIYVQDLTIECDQSTNCEDLGKNATAHDNCSPDRAISLSFVDYVQQGNCQGVRTIRRCWTAIDECGNKATADQIIHVVDTTPPYWVYKVDRCIVDCGENISKCGVPTAKDNCDKYLKPEYQDQVCGPECPYYSRVIKRTWTVKDCSGNVVRDPFVQYIYIKRSNVKSVTFNPFCLWPPNHFFYAVNLNQLVTAQFECVNPGSNSLYVQAINCTSNQSEESTGDGNFTPDCYIDQGVLYVRAERAGNIKSDRVYTIALNVYDSQDPTCRSFTKTIAGPISVPHDQRNHPECYPANTDIK